MKNLKLMGHQLTRHQMRTIDGGGDPGKVRGALCSCNGGRSYNVSSCLSNECSHMCAGEGWICSGS